MASRIFLNYRRADAEAWADRLFERLIKQFSREHVFMDIDGNIPFGFPWATWLDEQVAACDLMLVLIGRNWVAELRSRADQSEPDFVRVEIESALGRGIPVVPVYLGDTLIPLKAELPKSMHSLLALQAARLHRTSFGNDAEKLISGLERSIALSRATDPLTPAKRYNSEGRIKVDARFTAGAPDGWFKPGAGRTEWFKDIENGPEMVVVPRGNFLMGSRVPNTDPKYAIGLPQRRIDIREPFAVSRFTVTRRQFSAFVTETNHQFVRIPPFLTDDEPTRNPFGPYRTKPDQPLSWNNPGIVQDDSHPVVHVNWHDARAYAAWLSKTTGKRYRLPTEAQWEYVARGIATATTSHPPYWWGETIVPGQANLWIADQRYTTEPHPRSTVPVDSFSANQWGLFNVHGNVCEWCEDGSDGNDAFRQARGGSWYHGHVMAHSDRRNPALTGLRSPFIGFRLIRGLLD